MLIVAAMEHNNMRIEIEKLDGATNWRSWKMDIEDALVIKGVAEFIREEQSAPTEPATENQELTAKYQVDLKKFNQQFSLARSVLRGTLGSEAKLKVSACETPYSIWRKLHDVYEQNSTSRLRRLLTQVLRAKKDADTDMGTHLGQMRANWVDLQNAAKQEENVSIPECILIECVFESLPQDSYREFSSLWDTLSKESRKIDKLEQLLLERATRETNSREFVSKVDDEEQVGFVVKSNGGSYNGVGKNGKNGGNLQNGGKCGVGNSVSKSTGGGVFKGVCYVCNKQGHMSRFCPDRRSGSSTGNESDNSASNMMCANVSLVAKEVGGAWYCDTGASQHITNDPDRFFKFELFKKPIFVRVGSGEQLQVTGQGDLRVEILINGRWNATTLANVWYIENFSNNLFSVQSTMRRQNKWQYRATSDDCILFDSKTGDVKLHGDFIETEGLYKLRLRVLKPDKPINVFLGKSPCNLQSKQGQKELVSAPSKNQGELDSARSWSSVVKGGKKNLYQGFEPKESKQVSSRNVCFNPDVFYLDISLQDEPSGFSSMGETKSADCSIGKEAVAAGISNELDVESNVESNVELKVESNVESVVESAEAIVSKSRKSKTPKSSLLLKTVLESEAALIGRVGNALSAVQVAPGIANGPPGNTGLQLQEASNNRRAKVNKNFYCSSVLLLQGRRDSSFHRGAPHEDFKRGSGSDRMTNRLGSATSKSTSNSFGSARNQIGRKGFQHGRVLSFVNKPNL